mmetsp:Transcript_6584/g.7189  ORF Transcript_6584/g.7189 Transcript_6584/m.7189 type:complete len:228 (-) Transcript_6584:102-785(-)
MMMNIFKILFFIALARAGSSFLIDRAVHRKGLTRSTHLDDRLHPLSFNSMISSIKDKHTLSLSPQEVIEFGVSFDSFAPQFLWLPMIVAPNAGITKKIMGANGIAFIIALSLVHLTIVVNAAAQEGALDQVLIFKEVFDPSMSQLAGMQKLFQFPNFVAEEWPHVLIWDLFVGRMIWLDGIEREIDTRVALSFCNFIGPPGFLIHVLMSLLNGKGLPTFGYSEKAED